MYTASFCAANTHDDVIKWKHFPRYWPFVRGIHRSPVNSPHKGQWRGALMFSLICVVYVYHPQWKFLNCYHAINAVPKIITRVSKIFLFSANYVATSQKKSMSRDASYFLINALISCLAVRTSKRKTAIVGWCTQLVTGVYYSQAFSSEC